jgi:hypothetical protein
MQMARKSIQLHRAGLRGAALLVALFTVTAGALSDAQAGAASKHARTEAHSDLLRLSDLPTGWKALTTTSTTSSGTSGGGTTTSEIPQIATCEGITISTFATTRAHAQVQYGDQKTIQFAFEFIGVFPTTKDAEEAYRLFATAKAPTCVGPSLAQQIAATSSTAKVTATKIVTTHLAFPPEGSESTALKLTVPLTAEGTAVSLDIDLVIIRHGKVLALVAPMGLSGKLTAKFVHSLAAKAAGLLH